MLVLTTNPAQERRVIRNGNLTNVITGTILIPRLGSLDFDKCAYASKILTVLYLQLCSFLETI